MNKDELTDFRLGEIEYSLRYYEDVMMAMRNNMEHMLNTMVKMKDRIEVLEHDLSERKHKKYIFNLLISFYPFLMAVMMFFMSSDHSNIHDVLNKLGPLIQQASELNK
jgi:hypothetical protein